MRILICMLTLCTLGVAATTADASDRRCLAEMVYLEARGESLKGQEAVAHSIMNRVKSPGYPKTVCGVVSEKGQFAPRRKITDAGSLRRADQVAAAVLSGKAPDVTNGATHFHAAYVKPSWSKRMQRTARIGSHSFYRKR